MPVGTLVLPPTSSVRKSVGYGANGTEFVGTFLCPPSNTRPVPPPRPIGKTESYYSNQSVTVAEVLDAVKSLLLAATGYHESKVIEWHFANRPTIDQGGTIVWFRHLQRKPDAQSGAGRAGTKCDLVLEINQTTRGFRDRSQRDTILMRQHLATTFQIENAFWGQDLFEAYGLPDGDEPPQPIRRTRITESEATDRRFGRDGATPIILSHGGTMTAAELPAPDRPRPEQGYLETRIGVNIPVLLRLTLNSVPSLE